MGLTRRRVLLGQFLEVRAVVRQDCRLPPGGVGELFGVGAAGLAGFLRRRRRKAARPLERGDQDAYILVQVDVDE